MKASPRKRSKTGVSKKRNCEEIGDVGQSSSPPSSPHSNPAKEWKNAKLKTENLLALVNSVFLHEKEMDLWRTTTSDPYRMEKNPDEIPMFTWFMERGLALPASDFFKGMLRYYDIEYLNLNHNGIFHTSIFMQFCEAFVGIKPHCYVHMPSHTYIIESRTTPFQEKEDDVDIPRVTQVDEGNTPININHGPITRSRAKKLQQEVNSLLAEINFNISENVILPKYSTLVVLRYICERGGAAIHREEAKKKNQVDQFGPRMNQQVQFGQVRTDQFGQSVQTSSDRSVRTCSDLHNDLIITLKFC
jgi:hypothetical protein